MASKKRLETLVRELAGAKTFDLSDVEPTDHYAPTEEDREEAERLISEGWQSISTKHRLLARMPFGWPTLGDMLRPEFAGTPVVKLLEERWDSWHGWYLRCGKGVEKRTVSPRTFRAFKQAGGRTA